jgi:hypothetical protein
MTNKEAKEKLYMEWQKFLEDNIDYAGISEAYKMAFKALEQEPKIEKVIKMRDATPEERESIDKYIKSISKPTGVDFGGLKRQPCDDCIGRQAVNNLQKYRYNCGDTSITCISLKSVNDLPPVTSQQKIGHWKFVQRGKYIDICCSNCGYQRVKEYAYNYTVDQISEQDIKDLFSNTNMNFCENCGAKMRAESDHKCHNCKHYTSGERDGSCGSYICKNYSGWESEEKG